ncbi:MAG: sodium/solute symporter [Myxococcales bacterium]|nr:sodium/solute symporter [Myxococcales bacterium]
MLRSTGERTLGSTLSGIDCIIVIIYILASVTIGLWVGRRNQTAEDYFLAGRQMTWPYIGGSLFASNISTTTLVGLAGAAYVTGISVYNYEWMATVVLAIFAIFFIPIILRSGVFTMPQFLELRFSPISRIYFACLTLFLNVVVDTAGGLYAGTVLLSKFISGVEQWQLTAGLAVAAGAYTISGGLTSVMITDVIQAVILVIASILITVYALDKLGDWDSVVTTIPAAKLSLIQPLSDPDMPWLGLLLGVPLLGFYFWNTNQFMAQRMLAAPNAEEARLGALFAGALKIPVLWIMVLPGTMAAVLYPNLTSGDEAYPTLLLDLLPTGILGLAVAGFVAALMSSISSTLNSASTLVTMDFVQPLAPQISQSKLMRIGQVATFLFMLFSVIWAPQIGRFPSLFAYLQQVLAYAVGPVLVLFFFGVFWSRANARGAHATIVIGLLSAIVLFFLNVVYHQTDIHFLYIAPIVFAISSIAMVIASLSDNATQRHPESTSVLLFSWSEFTQETLQVMARPLLRNYLLLSAVLIVTTIAVVYVWR